MDDIQSIGMKTMKRCRFAPFKAHSIEFLLCCFLIKFSMIATISTADVIRSQSEKITSRSQYCSSVGEQSKASRLFAIGIIFSLFIFWNCRKFLYFLYLLCKKLPIVHLPFDVNWIFCWKNFYNKNSLRHSGHFSFQLANCTWCFFCCCFFHNNRINNLKRQEK